MKVWESVSMSKTADPVQELSVGDIVVNAREGTLRCGKVAEKIGNRLHVAYLKPDGGVEVLNSPASNYRLATRTEMRKCGIPRADSIARGRGRSWRPWKPVPRAAKPAAVAVCKKYAESRGFTGAAGIHIGDWIINQRTGDIGVVEGVRDDLRIMVKYAVEMGLGRFKVNRCEQSAATIRPASEAERSVGLKRMAQAEGCAAPTAAGLYRVVASENGGYYGKAAAEAEAERLARQTGRPHEVVMIVGSVKVSTSVSWA